MSVKAQYHVECDGPGGGRLCPDFAASDGEGINTESGARHYAKVVDGWSHSAKVDRCRKCTRASWATAGTATGSEQHE